MEIYCNNLLLLLTGLDLGDLSWLHQANVREVTVLSVEVKAVSEDEDIINLESGVSNFDWELPLAFLVQESADLDGSGVSRGHILDELRKGQTSVNNVLDDKNVAASEVSLDILLDFERTSGLVTIAIAGDGHEFHFHEDIHLASQVSKEKNGTTEDTDDNWILILVVVSDLSSKFTNSLLDLFTGEKNSLDILIHAQPK